MKDPLPQAVLETPDRGRYYRMLPEVRRIRYPEIAGWFDPDTLASSPLPPPEMTSAAEEVFGDKIRWDAVAKDKSRPPDPTKKGWLKLRFHPWFHRWTLFEWAACPKDRKFYWRPVYIAAQQAKDGVLPEDLNHSDGRFDDLRGKLGEFYVPTKEDFADFLNLASHEVNETAAKEVRKHTDRMDAEQREKERIQEDYTRAFNDYYAALACRDINRQFGTMQGLPFLPQTSLETIDKEKQARIYNVEERNGYKVLHKKNRPVPDEDYIRWVRDNHRQRWEVGELDHLQTEYLRQLEELGYPKVTFDEWMKQRGYTLKEEEKVLVPA